MAVRERILLTALGIAVAACSGDTGGEDSGETSGGANTETTVSTSGSGSSQGTDGTGTTDGTGATGGTSPDSTATDDTGGSGSSTGSVTGCTVPDDYESIQAGVDDRVCSTLFVRAGVYVENIVIDRVMVIEAVEPGTVTVDGAGAGRVIDVDAMGPVALRGLTITGGNAATGAGIHSVGDVALASCVVEGNTASEGSAGIHGEAGVSLEISAVQDNAVVAADVDVYGGGVHAVGGLHLDSSVVANNTVDLQLSGATFAGASGAGVLSDGPLDIVGDSEITGNTITIDGVDGSASGAGISVNDDLTIGAGAVIADNAIVISTGGEIGPAQAYGGGIGAILGDVSISGATISGNTIATDSFAGFAYGGGAYVAIGSVTITDSTVTGNAASVTTSGAVSFARGGGMYVDGDLLVQTSAFGTNTTTGIGGPPPPTVEGGGIYVTGPLTATDSTFTANGASGGGAHGAAIAVADSDGNTVAIQRCTLSANEAIGQNAFGGGLWVNALAGAPATTTVAMTNATVSGNLADGPTLSMGGGVALQVAVGATGQLHLASSTLALNDAGPSTPAGHGGGLWTQGTGAEVFARNTIVAGNLAAQSPDCSTPALTSSGYNLIGDVTDCAITGGPDLLGVDPALVALAANGGPTQTHALVAATPPVDAGDPAGCTDVADVALTVDQRGENRHVGGACDIGAIELQ